MGKNQSASNLTNIIKQDANGNITFVSGSTTLMSVSSSGAITTTGNVAGTASYASNAELLDGLDSTVFTLTSSFAAQTASFTAFSASINSFSASVLSYTASQNITNGTFTTTSSFNAQTASFTAFTSSVNTFTASQNILNGTYATTGSNTFTGIQTVNSNLIVTGSITAQTLVVQTITSSVDFVTGSTRFGSLSSNTHVFTGSMSISGSISAIGAATFSSSVTATTGTTGATIKLGGFTNYGTIQDTNDVRRIWFENVGSYRTIFDLPVSGTSFAFRTNDGTSLFNLASGSVSTLSGDLSVATAGSTAVLFDGTNPTLTLSRNNNGNASAAINFKGSSAVKWQIGTNQSTGLGLEINEGDATANRFYMAPGGAVTFSSTGVFSSNVNVLRANIGGASNDADISLNVSAPSGAGKYIMFGRNSSHTAVMALDSDGNIGCVSYNVNSAMNLGGQVLGTVSTSWVSTNLTTLYVGFVFIYWADSNSGERNTAVITCNYYPSGVTVISSSNNGGKGMQFQMSGSTLQLKTTTGTAAGVQLVYWKV